MCGISGIFDSSGRSIDSNLISRMTNTLDHRGPDDRGIYVNENIGLGMTRLAIIDLSRNAHQPMSNEDKSIWIVFNGEIYNHNQLRNELESKGHRYKSNSDTESILHLYEEYGIECVNKLNGMFAFAIWDEEKRELFIARDRLGIKPLYYAHISDIFCFASEIKAILCHPKVKKTINLQALDHYFSCLAVPHPGTIYNNISTLEPGHFLVINNGRINKKKYWDINEQYREDCYEDEAVTKTGRIRRRKEVEEYYIYEITKRLKKSVELRMISDVPLGIFLSGGVDSSLILALMSEISAVPIKTFSVLFDDGHRNYNELKYCRIVANKYGTNHREFIQNSDVATILPELINYFDEPFANPTAVPMYYISKIAREYVTVALSGVGGDELFAGYPRHIAIQLLGCKNLIPGNIQNASLYLLKKFQQNPDPYSILDRAKRFLSVSKEEAGIAYKMWRTSFFPSLKDRLYSDELKSQLTCSNNNFVEHSFLEAPGHTVLDKALLTDLKTQLPIEILSYCDRMSMATSLEMRVPFCDHEFVEFAMSIPSKHKLNRFQLKYLLKKVAQKYLPKEVIYRKKQGFSVPVGHWIKDDLKPLIDEYLLGDFIRKQGYLNSSTVRQILKDHDNGRANYSSHIWALLVFQMWHEQNMS